jgi:hypothetical protein
MLQHLCHRRLRDDEGARRCADRAVGIDRVEDFDVAQIHSVATVLATAISRSVWIRLASSRPMRTAMAKLWPILRRFERGASSRISLARSAGWGISHQRRDAVLVANTSLRGRPSSLLHGYSSTITAQPVQRALASVAVASCFIEQEPWPDRHVRRRWPSA